MTQERFLRRIINNNSKNNNNYKTNNNNNNEIKESKIGIVFGNIICVG